MFKLKSLTTDQWFLAGIILVTTILRFWRFWEFDYVHDEISALTRMEYSSWSDFYHFGVELDGHPAGVHLFIKLLYSIVGDTPFLIRLPFSIFSILCVYQVYKFGKEWFSSSIGLISAAFFSVIQYAIYQGVVARPYSPGLLISLLLIRVWTSIFISKNKDWKLFVTYGILLSLLGYIHYFALLFGAAISLIGLFWLKKDIIVKFLSAGLIAFVMYIPHLNTFFYQLNTRGLEWLNEPDATFLQNYLMYIFNHSNLFLGSVILGTFYFIIQSFKQFVPLEFKKRITLLVLFFIPYVVGYYYSIHVSPVLQYSLLIFGFPCLLIFIFSFWGKNGKHLISLLGITILGITTLITERNHFNWFYKNPMETFFTFCKEPNTLNVGRYEPVFADFYKKRFQNDFQYYSLDDDCTTVKEFQELLQSSNHEKLIMANLFPREIALAHKYFPVIEVQNQGNGYENFVFSKQKKNLRSLYYTQKDLPLLKGNNTKTTFNKVYQLNFELSFDSLIRQSHDIIDVCVELELDTLNTSKVILVTEVEQGDQKIKWLGANTEELKPDGSNKCFLINSYSIPFEEDSLSNLTVKGYLWNPDKTTFKVNNYEYGIRKGNKNRFADFEKLRN